MNLEKYTQKSQEALLAAQRLAQDYQQQIRRTDPLAAGACSTAGWDCAGDHHQSVWRNASHSR